MGQLNLVPVEIIDPREQWVCFDGQVVRAGRLVEKNSTEQARLAVRPEELRPGYRDGHKDLRGKIESVHYLGSIVRIQVNMSGIFFSMDIYNERNLIIPQVGDAYEMNSPVDACWII